MHMINKQISTNTNIANLLDPAMAVCTDGPSTRATTKRLARTNFIVVIAFLPSAVIFVNFLRVTTSFREGALYIATFLA